MSKKYLIMDVDTGCDDSMALMLAAAQENFEILALTCTFGNNEVEKTTYNTLKVAQALGIDAPVASGAKRPLIDPPMDFSGGLGIAIHGADGLGNVGDTLKEPVKEKSRLVAADLMAKAIKEAPDKVTIVATGPLTNVATFLVSYPELQDKIEQIAIMGGAAYSGNMRFYAEANVGHDPEAAQIVFMSGVPIAVFGLDATMGVYITDEEREEMAKVGGEIGTFLKNCLEPYAATYRRLANYPGAVLHDSLPVAWLIDESVADMHDAYIEVGLNGIQTRGCTVADFIGITGKPVNAKMAMSADRKKVIDMHIEAVKKFADRKVLK